MKLILAKIPESLQKGDSDKAFSGSDSAMNAGYERLEAEAREVQNQINELVSSCSQLAAADFPMFEAKIRGLHQRLVGLQEEMGLLKLAGSRKMQAQAAYGKCNSQLVCEFSVFGVQ